MLLTGRVCSNKVFFNLLFESSFFLRKVQSSKLNSRNSHWLNINFSHRKVLDRLHVKLFWNLDLMNFRIRISQSHNLATNKPYIQVDIKVLVTTQKIHLQMFVIQSGTFTCDYFYNVCMFYPKDNHFMQNFPFAFFNL